MELQLPLFQPVSDWTPPTHLPDLSHEKEIAIDCETRDPDLDRSGPGFITRLGHVAGVGIAAGDWWGYFPLAHLAGGNLASEIIIPWLRDVLGQRHCDYIFANAQYDLGWLRTLGLEVHGRINDIQIADCLLDEENPEGFSLDAVARRWTGEGKDETLLRQAALDWGLDPKKDLWKLPAKLVGPYAEKDPVRTLAAWRKIKPALEKEGLWEAYQLERKLTPILSRMHWRGIRVDRQYAEKLNETWLKEEDRLKAGVPGTLDIWSTADLARYCDSQDIRYPRTPPTKTHPKGQPSIKKDFLEKAKDPTLQSVHRLRAFDRIRSVYLEENLIRNVHNGRIHPQYIQMASDEGGTRTFRLACRNPNAQQFPKRSTLFDAKSLRKCLVSEDDMLWAKFDYWSQEPVIQLHYALGAKKEGAERVREQFLKKVKLYTFIEEATHGACNYDQAKAVALGRSYGMGENKMADTIGLPLTECGEILEAFDRIVPYVKELAQDVMDKATARGWIRLLCGHKRHFNQWEVPYAFRNDPRDNYAPCSFEQAQARWPGKPIQRAWTYKAFNSLIQGGAAGQTKTALVSIAETIRDPHMTVHDEISVLVKDEAEARQVDEIMCHCVPLLSPVYTDCDLGPSWK